MSRRKPSPGISREERIGDSGLQRLEAQLRRGSCPADAVLTQWLRRYGDAVRDLLQHYGRYRPELEPQAGAYGVQNKIGRRGDDS